MSLTVDDLLIAARAVTAAETHPGLHAVGAAGYVEYFTTTSVEQLIADAAAQHEAIWPAVENVIRKHAAWGPPIVIDGWAVRPVRVAALDVANLASLWLVADPTVLMNRERGNERFFAASLDPERMFTNFLGRSLWHNDLIRREAAELGLRVLHQDGHTSVDALCDAALAGGSWDGQLG
jgi:2-phosphoglycerate kinase